MRVISTLTLNQEGSEATLVRALAEGAMAAVQAEFGREGYGFAMSVVPDPDGVEITVSFYTSLSEKAVDARMPLASALLDLPWDRTEVDYG